MCDTLLIQFPPMLPQRGYNPINFHVSKIYRKRLFFKYGLTRG
jgi:hypothetical protein